VKNVLRKAQTLIALYLSIEGAVITYCPAKVVVDSRLTIQSVKALSE
jgi:hypothetical protein